MIKYINLFDNELLREIKENSRPRCLSERCNCFEILQKIYQNLYYTSPLQTTNSTDLFSSAD